MSNYKKSRAMYYTYPDNYDPIKKKYEHICPVDGELFWGRKNQIYHPWCKVWHGNHKTGEFNKETKYEDNIRRNNLKIIKAMIKIFGLNEFFPEIMLKNFNFDYTRKAVPENGCKVYLCYNYRLLIDEDFGAIITNK
jgi:hypothetical protein